MIEQKPEKPPFFFIQMTDPQFGMTAANADFDREVELFTRAIAHANRLGPNFVIITGDLINKPGDEEQIAAVLHIADQLNPDIKMYYLPGNHDIGDAPTLEQLNWFRQRISPDWYSFELGDWHFIALNSCIIFKDENVPAEYKKQWRWLNQDFARAAERGYKNFLVFMHHSLFLERPDEADDEYFNIPQRVREDYLELFGKYQVRAVLAGHRHIDFQAAAGAMQMITTAPVGMPLADDPSGFRIVKINGDHLEHQYFGLDDMPEKIAF
jgi:3',5'-cyclic AMP phosphodiesterase CpdA